MKITLELEVGEALIALGPIQDRALEASRLAAISTGDEHEMADMTSRLLNRVATRITDALYPTCLYMHEDEPCGAEYAGHVGGHPYCRFHRDLLTTYPVVTA